MKNYYLSINKNLLANLMEQALIYPIYNSDQAITPIEQRKYGNLILQKEKKYINNDDCILEIALNDEEIKNLNKSKISQDIYIYIYNKPLPISRISKIFFKKNTDKSSTISRAKNSAYINEQICDIFNENANLKIAENNLEKIKKDDYSDELKLNIKKYDQILGGIAFARYDTNEFYNENYFSILSYFNKVFKDELNKNKLKINENFKGAFGFEQEKSEFWEKLYTLIYKPIDENDVKQSADEEKISITKNSANIFDFEKIDTKKRTYNLAILQIYRQKNSSKSIDDLIFGFKSGKIPKDKQEGISLLIGINNGYKSFRDEQKNVKFKMDSLLDYYTIESIFQHAINNKQNCSSFEYIDKIAPKKQEDESFDLDKKKILYYILDEAVYENKTFFDEYLQEFKNNQDNMGLISNLRNILQKPVNIINENFKKNLELKSEKEKLEKENETLKKENEALKNEIKQLKENKKNDEIKLIGHKTNVNSQDIKQVNDENLENNSKVQEDEKQEQESQNLNNESFDKQSEQNFVENTNKQDLEKNKKPEEEKAETIENNTHEKNITKEENANNQELEEKNKEQSASKDTTLFPDLTIYTDEQLIDYNIQELRNICKQKSIKYSTKDSKNTLIALIRKAQNGSL